MRFQILTVACNAVTLLVTKRLLKVAQNQNISVKRTETGKAEKFNPGILSQSQSGELTTTQGTPLIPAGWSSACLLLSLELGARSSHPPVSPTPTVTASVCKLFKYFGSRKTEVGDRGMNFQSVAWQISTQITLLLMGFVGLSFMLCFENSFHSVY